MAGLRLVILTLTLCARVAVCEDVPEAFQSSTESSSSETSIRSRQGVPFFIADDGKSIRLPPNDLVYDKETGQIMIRNRSKNLDEEAQRTYMSIRPEGLKNLQGFMIADETGRLSVPLLYTTSSESTEKIRPIEEVIAQKSEELSANEAEVEIRTEMFDEEEEKEHKIVKPIKDVEMAHIIHENARTAKQKVVTPYSINLDDGNAINPSLVPEEAVVETEGEEEEARELHFAPDATNAVERETTSIGGLEVESGKVVNLINYSTSTTTEAPNTLESLRTFLEDIYLRGPIAIMVDVEQRNLVKTREMWNSMEVLDGILKLTDVVLIGYDGEGITWMSHHRGTGSQRLEYEAKSFKKALYGLKPSVKTVGAGNPEPALARTVRLLPYDSAIFLFCSDQDDQGVEDPAFVARLQKMLLTKRIKLYTISESKRWTSTARASGGASLSIPEIDGEEHQRDLRALSIFYDSSGEDELEFDEQQMVVLKSGLFGDQSLAIPVDSSIKVMTVTISAKPQLAMLYGPEAIRIDLLDVASVRNFSYGSDIIVQSEKLAVRLDMNPAESETEDMQMQAEPYQGIWRLTLRNDNSTVQYEVEVKAETTVRVMAKITPYFGAYDRTDGSKIKLAVGGSVASVREAIVVDRQGQKVVRLPYRYREGSASGESDTTDIESLRAMESGTLVKEILVPKEMQVGLPYFIQVTGRNDKDEQFVRISQEIRVLTFDPEVEELSDTTVIPLNVNNKTHEHQIMVETPQNLGKGLDGIQSELEFNYNLSRQLQPNVVEGQLPFTTIQIGASSRLYGAPGSQMQIHFEVTNHRDNAVYFRFGAKDDQYYLRNMAPLRQWINAGQTANIVLTVGITSGTTSSSRDTITFTANGLEQSTLSLYVYVETNGQISSDRSRPWLRHDFRGDCMGYLGSDHCRSKFWGLDINARDTDSGLMRINAASSSGILTYYPGFYAGMREEARARFTASCCDPQVTISATDVNGNIASYELNVSLDLEDIDIVGKEEGEQGIGEVPDYPAVASGAKTNNEYFTPAAIAAICLGILLFIALVIVIVLVVRACLKKRRDSRDLPSYSTQRPTRSSS